MLILRTSALQMRTDRLYFKYSPVNLLDTSYGPKFHPMSAGILLMF